MTRFPLAQVFEMLVGRWLFHPADGGLDFSLEDDHLAKMMECTGERFREAMLERAERRGEYFDEDGNSMLWLAGVTSAYTSCAGNLLRVDELFVTPVEEALANYKILPPEQIEPAAQFIRKCIRLNPEDRPSAQDLLSDDWLRDII